MRGMSRAGRAAAGGVVAGIVLALILCMAASALAVVTGGSVGAEGFFAATAGQENGSLAVVFTPDWGAVALVALGAAVVSAVMARRRSEKD